MSLPNSQRSDEIPGISLVSVLLISAFAYTLATVFTSWVFIGDAPDYAESVVAQFSNGDCSFLEFGHVLWRTTGYLLFRATSDIDTFSGNSRGLWVRALSLLTTASWVAGLITVLASVSWLRFVTMSSTAALVGVAFIIVNKAFLNFSQVGTSYVPALACLSLALLLGELGARVEKRRILLAVVAGVALAGSMLYWATYVFIAPAALFAPMFLSKHWKMRLPGVAVAGLSCTIFMLCIYAWVGHVLGLNSIADYKAWISDSQHGISFGGPARAAIGLARFIVDLGGFGPLTKRYLVGDPFNPVTLGQLINLDLFKMLGVYVFACACILLAGIGKNGRRIIAFFTVAFGPMFAFGVFWQGGDLERFLPALIVLAFLVAEAYRSGKRWTWATFAIIAAIASIGLINSYAMSEFRIKDARADNMARLDQFPEESLRRDLFVVSHWHDPLMTATRDNPFDQRVLDGLTIYPLVTTGMPDAIKWREHLGSNVLSAWTKGRRVWISTRLLAVQPGPSWAWVEGDDDRLPWKDFPTFFAQLEFEPTLSNSHGEFQLLIDSPANRAILEPLQAALTTPVTAVVTPPCRRIKVF